MVLRRPCICCNRMFQPTGKYTKHCKKCFNKAMRDRWPNKRLRDRVPGEELALNIKHQLKDEERFYSIGYMFSETLAIGLIVIPRKHLDKLGIKGVMNCGDVHHHKKLECENAS